MAERNPPWSRDELLVALDFYLRYSPSIPSKTSIEIIDLSNFLNRLQRYTGGERAKTFRNVNGVYMKLMNFRRFDQNYSGTGLARGNKDEGVVWELFSSEPIKLSELVSTIRSLVENITKPATKMEFEEIESEASEGRVLTRFHRFRERDNALVAKKKFAVERQMGRLNCEACGFDFKSVYGARGDGFIECHHTKPVSELKVGEITKLGDLALLCSNCHRMIHRSKPWLSIAELKDILHE